MNPLIDITITIYFVIEKFDEPYMYVKSEYSGCSDVNSNMLDDKFLYEERRKVADKNNIDIDCVRVISKKEFESRNKDEYFSFE